MSLMTELTIFVLAAFVGFEVISKVPTTLHTPLMSQTAAIKSSLITRIATATRTMRVNQYGIPGVISAS